MGPSWLKSLIAVCVPLVVSVRAHAQPLFGSADSIESTVANADSVVVGKIVEFGGGEQADEREGRPATIAVEETLKGGHRDRLRVRLSYPPSTLGRWKDQSCQLLVAKGFPPTGTTVIDLASKELEVLTADFTLLRKPECVIRSAKEAIRRMPGVKQIETFALVAPAEAVAGTKWREYHATILSVPVDERLEQRAHDYIRSDSYHLRREGARALRYFKSDENITRVKTLFDDTSWAYLHHAEQNKGLEVRIYGVREEAYQTLRYWGVDAEIPTIREEIMKLESVKTVDLSNTPVTDMELEELIRFENLEDLFLWNTPVTDASLKELGGLRNLRTLYLAGTRVTDEGLKHLSGLMSLRYLDLGDTKVTDEGVAELRKLRPDLEIDR